MLLAPVSGNGPGSSASSVASSILPCSIWALIRKSRIENPIQPATKTATHLATRFQVQPLRPLRARCGLGPSGPCSSGGLTGAPSPRLSLLSSDGRLRYFVYFGGSGPVMGAVYSGSAMPAGCVIGVDLGGTKLLAGVVDRDLAVYHRAVRRSSSATTEELLDKLVAAVTEVRESASAEFEVLAVGIGIPSLVDLERGVPGFTAHLPLAGLPFRDVMAERLALPVFVANDATLAMLAEHRYGAARGVSDAVMLTVGTGIGGGLVVGGRLVHGAVGAAGEEGHMVVDLGGPPCTCGSEG